MYNNYSGCCKEKCEDKCKPQCEKKEVKCYEKTCECTMKHSEMKNKDCWM